MHIKRMFPPVIEPSSVEIRRRPCICTTEEESGHRCEAAAVVIYTNTTLLSAYMLR